jgi:hypothetical protein
MQKATFAITILHIASCLYLQFLHFMLSLHSLHRPNHESSIQSITSRFYVHETLQINQSNFLIFNPAFVRVYRESKRSCYFIIESLR